MSTTSNETNDGDASEATPTPTHKALTSQWWQDFTDEQITDLMTGKWDYVMLDRQST